MKQLGRRLGLDRSLGVYISVPFCRAKCTYCNFASGVFAAERMDAYVEQVCAEVRGVRAAAERMGGPGLKPTGFEATHRGLKPAATPKDGCAGGLAGVELPEVVDSVYFGGGTPSLLSAEHMRRLFSALSGEFAVSADAEVTVECAPGQLGDATLEEMLRQGMNRVSFGVQSFVDAEAKAVGRLHTRTMCLKEIARMRAAGVGNINVDLIVGLPGQTAASWRESVEVALETGVPHVSVYMLEVDEDSRLGREMLMAGARYGASAVPSEDEIAEWYGAGCEWLEAGGVRQYEISNFAREGRESRHNKKYWRREPYLGFGLDAHSMLRSGVGGVRWANADDLGRYEMQGRHEGRGSRFEVLGSSGAAPEIEVVGKEKAFEEAMFLGLRMNEGVELEAARAEFGDELMRGVMEVLGDIEEAGLVVREGGRVRLTARGRMASNEVFGRLLVEAVA